jgi:hypothetical protein
MLLVGLVLLLVAAGSTSSSNASSSSAAMARALGLAVSGSGGRRPTLALLADRRQAQQFPAAAPCTFL